MVGKRYRTQDQLNSTIKADSISLVTADGLIEVDRIVELYVDELGFRISAYVLLESPPALLEWAHRAENAVLIAPDGRVLKVPTIAHCP